MATMSYNTTWRKPHNS